MKICLAQTHPAKGDIARNIERHIRFIDRALAHGTDLIVFPELSLTGYEPTLAQQLATTRDDPRFDVFQRLSDYGQITIGVGVPTRTDAGCCISLVLFQPHQAGRTYSKKYIHADEEPFFISGTHFPVLPIDETQTALAICYELSIPDHAAAAFEHGAEVYVASVAKTASGVESASQRLAEIAATYAAPALMANGVGPSDDFVSAGQSAVWNRNGDLLARLGTTDEGILVFETMTEAVRVEMIP